MKNKKIMTKQDAARIQSNSDRTGKNTNFKRRAQRAATKNQGPKK